MNSIQDHYIAWLRDAHAMEKQAETMLTTIMKRVGSYPELQKMLEQHRGETREQERLIRECIERHGSTASIAKDMTAQISGMAQGLSSLFASDEVVKTILALYTFKHMEIASYKILISAASERGDAETRRVCESILLQEERMATWIEEHLASLTQQFLQHEKTTD